MTSAQAQKALLGVPAQPQLPGSELIVRVAKDAGLSPFRQMREIATLRFGQTRMTVNDYYQNRVYLNDLSPAQKREFVGIRANYMLNQALSPKHMSKMRPFIDNKVLYGAMLHDLGIPTTRTQAVAAAAGHLGNIPVLQDVDAVLHFLRRDAQYPVFGKPRDGSRSIGSACITGYDQGNDTVQLGNGKTFDAVSFATEVMTDYADGYVFQDAVAQHADMTALAGPAVGSVRITTVNDGSGPQVLYAVWKMPSPKAMSDNFWQAGSMLAALDADTGAVTRVVRGSGPDLELIQTHPVSQQTCPGFQIPHWQAACDLAVQAHDLFPEFGVFGFDIAIGQRGPLIIECNCNPAHSIYQTAHGEGIKNDRFMAQFDKAIARAAALHPDAIAKAKKAA